MKKLLLVDGPALGGGAAGVWYWNDLRGQHVDFRTTAIRRGDLLATVSATGTLEPEEVVDVGAQIAGQIESFGKDPRDPGKSISYGSPVEEGTVLAQLDDALFKARVDQARASLGKAEADVLQAQAKRQQAERDFERAQQPGEARPGLAQDYDTAQANYETAQANLTVAESSVALAGEPRGGDRQPGLHHDPLAGQRGHPRPAGQHRPDRRRQPERPASS